MEINEVKSLIEQGNKTIEAIRSEVESVKTNDVVTETKLAKMEKDLAETLSAKSALEARIDAMETAAARPGATKGEDNAATEIKNAFFKTLRNPTDAQKDAYHDLMKKSDLLHTGDASGGILVPTVFLRDILTELTEQSPIRQLATVIQTNTTDIRIPVAGTGTTVKWASELTEREPTDIAQFSDVKPTGSEMYSLVRISQWMLDDAYFDLEAWLRNEIVSAFAAEESNVFATGTGDDKPQGYLTAAAGVPVVNTGDANGLGANADALLTLGYNLKSGYRRNAKLVVNTATVAKLVTLKDSNGNYQFLRGLDVLAPDKFGGFEIVVDENIPGIAAGSNFAVIADWKKFYGIVDRVYFRMIRDNVTAPGFVRYYTSRRLYGSVLDKNAGVILKASA